MLINSGYFNKEKNKYRDTVVLIQVHNGEYVPFYIDLLIIYCCTDNCKKG